MQVLKGLIHDCSTLSDPRIKGTKYKMLKIMFSGPSFVIFGLEEINRASLQEVLVALAENSTYQ